MSKEVDPRMAGQHAGDDFLFVTSTVAGRGTTTAVEEMDGRRIKEGKANATDSSNGSRVLI